MTDKKTVFITHPINGDIAGNMKKVLDICAEIHDKNIIPVAPYLISLQYLDDNNPISRELGIDANLETFHRRFIDELWVYGDHLSPGMKQEIELAHSLNIPVIPKSDFAKQEVL